MAEGDGDGLKREIQALRQTLKSIALSNEQIDGQISIIKEEIILLRTEWNGLASRFFFMYVYFLKCMPLKSKLSIIYEYLLKQYLIFTIVFQSSTEGKSFFIKHLNIIHFQHSFNDYMVK